MSRKVVSLLVVTAIVWGISFPVIKYTLKFIDPLALLSYRFWLAAAVLVPLAYVGWRSSGEHLSWRRAALLSILGLGGTVLAIVFLYFAMNLAPVSQVVVLLSMNPIYIKLILAADKRIRLTDKQKIGILAAIIGAGILVWENFVGGLLATAAALAWAEYVVLSKFVFKKNTEKNSPMSLMALSNLAGAVALLPVLGLLNPEVLAHPLAYLDSRAAPGIFYLGVISTILGFVSYESAAKLVKPQAAGAIVYFQPLVAVPLAVWFLGEVPTNPLFWVGAGIIILGVLLTERS
jgi:drug/metabolite transporter (DMT)-like permease